MKNTYLTIIRLITLYLGIPVLIGYGLAIITETLFQQLH